jgi:intracellular sulfur oxidation DsrE/DsrF family protein
MLDDVLYSASIHGYQRWHIVLFKSVAAMEMPERRLLIFCEVVPVSVDAIFANPVS